MNNKHYWLTKTKYRAVLWLVLLIISSIWFVLTARHSKIESNITALLDGNYQVAPQVEKQLSASLNNSVIWLVGADNFEKVSLSAVELQASLKNIPQLIEVQGQNLAQHQEWQRYFFEHRALLLSEKLQQQLSDPTTYYQTLLAEIYSPFAAVSSAEINQDPLLLTRQQLSQQKNNKIQSRQGWIYTLHQGKYYILLRAKLSPSSDNIEQKTILVEQLSQVEQQFKKQFPDNEIYSRGSLFFSQAAAKSVEQDIKIIGLGSLFGVILLLLLVFRSIYPLFLITCSIISGIISGTLVTWLVFSEIHLLTIALSTSLIGVSADYSIHYFTERRFSSKNESAVGILKNLMPSISFAFATTALAYLTLCIAPINILRQMAVYAAFGLFASLITIYLLYPYFIDKIKPRQLTNSRKIEYYLMRWKNNKFIIPLVILSLPFLFYSITKLQVSDDIRTFQKQPLELQKTDKKITEILAQGNQLQYFIIQANDSDTLLQRSEQLKAELEKHQLSSSYSVLLSDYVPSQETQRKNYLLIENTLDILHHDLQQIGFNHIKHYPNPTLNLDQFIQTEIGRDFKSLYLNEKNGYYLLVPLSDGKSPQFKLLSQQVDGVSYHNLTQQWSDLFEETRNTVISILALSFVLVFSCLSYGFNTKTAVAALSIICFAMLTALSFLSIAKLNFNLFAALGLVLVLGMGVDYAVFLAKKQTHLSSSYLAIFLSALTTLLSFGLLILSQTNALISFAMVVSIGISISFIFMPLILKIIK